MRVFRRRRKVGNLDASSNRESLPDVVYQMGAEAAARFVAANRQAGNHMSSEDGVYSLPPSFAFVPVPIAEEIPVDESYEEEFEPEVRSSSPMNFIRSAIGLNRSRSRPRLANNSFERVSRVGSPEHFGGRRFGSPGPQRRSLASPEFFEPRAGSPVQFLSRPRSRPGSPEAIRRVQLAQLSQDLQRMERQRKLQQESLMNSYPLQFMPSFPATQPDFYPSMNPNIYPSNCSMPPQLSQPMSMYPYY